MIDPNTQQPEPESVIVSEDPKISVDSQISDPKRQLKKIITALQVKLAKNDVEDKDSKEDIDYNEIIADDDLRYLLVADVTADLIRTHKSSQIKSGYEDYVSAVKAAESIVPILLLLMGVFILFGRPEWCANLGTYVTYSCTHSLDPNNPIEYLVARTPMLSASTKTFICVVCMTAITAINLFKVGVTVSSPTHKNGLYFCLGLLISYYVLFAIETLEVANPMFMDIFPVLFTIFNLPALQKIVNKTVSIMILSKEIIIFYMLILIMIAISARAIFHGVPEFFDTDDSTYYLFNFENMANSIYTSIITFFFLESIYMMALVLFHEYKIYLIYWIVVGLFVKFFLVNLVCGVLAYYYNTLFDSEVKFMEDFPDLKQRIKEEIVRETAEYSRLKNMVKKYHKAGFFDKDIVEIEEFYRATTVNRGVTWNADNPHSVASVYGDLARSDKFIIGVGLLEFLGIVIIMASLGAENTQVLGLYIALFIVNALLFTDRIFYLISKRIDNKDYPIVIDLILTAIVGGLIIIHMLSSHEVYTEQLIMENRVYKKYIGFLFTVKAVRCFKLMLYQKEIKLVFEVALKSFGFIADILLIMIIIFFIFATIGISLFGGGVNTGSFKEFEKKYDEELSAETAHLNFNDYYHSFYTLSIVMLDSWLIAIRVATVSQEPSIGYNIFFILFFFISNMCFLNILFGFVVGSVDSYLQAAFVSQSKDAEKYSTDRLNLQGDSNAGDDDDDNDNKPDKGEANDEEGSKNQHDIERSNFSEDLDDYIDFKKKSDPKPETQDIEEELKNINSELVKSQAKQAQRKKLTLRPKEKNAGEYDPLDEIIRSIRFQKANE